jgi:hypothetical protein
MKWSHATVRGFYNVLCRFLGSKIGPFLLELEKVPGDQSFRFFVKELSDTFVERRELETAIKKADEERRKREAREGKR